MRMCKRLIPVDSLAGGKLCRVIGGLDAKGQGHAFPINDLGPFLYVEDAQSIVGPGQPPFGMHPHAGILAVSYVPAGDPWESLTNAPGAEKLPILAGKGLLSCAGRGVVHDEHTTGDGPHQIFQIVLRLPSSQHSHEAWIDPFEAIEVSDGVYKIFDAETLRTSGLQATLFHGSLTPQASFAYTPEDGYSAAFVYTRHGSLDVAGETIPAGHLAILSNDGTIEISNPTPAPCEFLCGAGVPIPEDWVKLLGHNGFVVAANLQDAEAKLQEYAQSPATFGHEGRKPDGH